jgi:hypothetical protein
LIDHGDFQATTLRALEKCQFVEETLKLCILSAIEITRVMTSPYMTINYEAGDIAKLPMGPLINKFSRISQDEALIRDLRSLTKDRNFVAHQSLLFTLGELSDTESAEVALNKLKAIGDKASALHERVLDVRYTLAREKQRAIRDSIKKNA